MSRYTYAGKFVNPTEGYIIKPVEGGYGLFLRHDERKADGSIPADRRLTGRSGQVFAEWEDAQEYIEGMAEFFEEDYDQYLEENRFELMQMERYEAFRDEY